MRKPCQTLLVAATVFAVLLAACGGDGKKEPAAGESPTAVAASPRTVPFTTLAVSQGPDGASGAAATARVSVGPSDTGELKVSFVESEVGGVGPQWQSAGWTAVALSSLLLGIDPRQYEYSFETGLAMVDGPSAGGVTTVAVLAAILGHEVREDAAMTGTVNPDGTIGPVGGIPHKIEGAAQAGKTLAVIPASQRFDTDMNTGEAVDLVQLGRRLGIEVKPVSTVYEAYEALTGQALPRTIGEATAEMPPEAFDKLKASATQWIGRYEAARNRIASLPDTLGFDADIATADQLAAAAESALGQGLAAVAYERAFSAAALAEGILQGIDLANAYLAGGMADLVNEVSALAAVETRLDATLQRLEAEQARTATDLIALADAYSNVAVAYGLINDADAVIQYIEQAELTEDEVLDLVFAIGDSYSQASYSLDAAENNLAYGLGFGQSELPEPEVVTAVAEALRRAAAANLAVVESTIIEPQATAYGVSADEVRNYLMSSDYAYSVAVGSADSATYFRQTIAEEPQASIAVLGASLTAWGTSALVVAKYYSLDARVDESMTVVEFGRERSLSDMLDLANERAVELLNLVAEEEPVNALYYHENARSYREGTAEDKLSALFYDWQAAVLAEAVAYFNGTFHTIVSESGVSPLWQWGAWGRGRFVGEDAG